MNQDLKSKRETNRFNSEKINLIFYFFFSVFAFTIFYTSFLFKESEFTTKLIMSFLSAILISLYLSFYLSYTIDSLEISENKFPRYGNFFSIKYWKKYDRRYLNLLIISIIIYFLVILIFSSIIALSNTSSNYNNYVIPFSFIFSIFTNLLLFFILFKRRINYQEPYLKQLLSLNVLTDEEFHNYSIQLRKDPELIHSYPFKENIFRNAIKKRLMLVKPLGNHLYYEMFYIFANTSPDYEEATDMTYDLLFKLINSEKYDSGIFLRDFHNLKDELFNSGKLNPSNWTMTEVLEIYLRK